MQTIFMVMGEMAVKRGGLTRVLLDRASLFVHNGYKVKILLLTWNPALKQIVADLQALGRVDSRVEFIDAHEFFVTNESEAGVNVVGDMHTKEAILFDPEYKIDLESFETDLKAGYYKDNLLVKIKKWKKEKSASNSLMLDWVFYPNPDASDKYFIDCFCVDNTIIHRVAYTKSTNLACEESLFGFDGKTKILKQNPDNTRNITLFTKTDERLSFSRDDECLAHLLAYACKYEKNKPVVIIDGVFWADVAAQVPSGVADFIIVSHTSHLLAPYTSDSSVIPFFDRAFKNWEKFVGFIVLTEEQKEDILAKYPEVSNIHVVPHFIPEERMNSQERLLSEGAAKSKAVCVTRLHEDKNIEGLLCAFEKVVARNSQAVLDIYGTGDLAEKLQNLAKELKLEKNVFFKGYIFDVNKAYASALFSILPAKSEGQCLALLESMLNSVPVVSYACKYGPKETITDGVDGFLVATDDMEAFAERINYAFEHKEEMLEFGRKGRESILRRFREKEHMEKWRKFLDAPLYSET